MSVLNCGVNTHIHILNNCSTDGTKEWLDDFFALSQSSVSITHQSENVGAIENYSCGFNSISTKYFVPLADDDELVPGFLPVALERANKHPEVIAVVGSLAVRKDDSWKAVWNEGRSSGLVRAEQHIKDFFGYGHYVTWSSI